MLEMTFPFIYKIGGVSGLIVGISIILVPLIFGCIFVNWILKINKKNKSIKSSNNENPN
jgi:uncharacterized membrane protein YciS (DUF1049 family)